MAQDGMTMKSDKTLDADITKATNFQEIQSLLHAAIERSPELGLTRDVETGRFVAREKDAPAAATTAAPRTFEKKGVVIKGKSFDFSAPSELELARQIASANEVAAALASDAAVTPRSSRAAYAKTQAEREQDIYDRTQLDLQFRRGELTTTEYLERTNAIGDYLAEQGVNVAALAQEQANKSWSEATEIFLQSEAGANWPGGTRNRQLLGDKLAALGLLEATDKVAAMAQAYQALKDANTLFDGDYSQKQLEDLTANMTPVEILESWKQTQPDVVRGNSDAANAEFIRIHNGGSGIFNK